ncbi:MAG TPA: 30S ribosomal protein S9 [Patescibacteria group bacterium]|nr:30S ribosomal protein S9 [Patescibacteria group bacterium]
MIDKKIQTPPAKTPKQKYIYTKGGRKTAIAQVRLFIKGKGNFEVNGKKYNEYFVREILQGSFLDALRVTGHQNDLDATVKVHGSGLNAQADACRHAISRALVELDPALRPVLKAEGFLTRDSRMKERKKPGLKRARRAPQWSKR